MYVTLKPYSLFIYTLNKIPFNFNKAHFCTSFFRFSFLKKKTTYSKDIKPICVEIWVKKCNLILFFKKENNMFGLKFKHFCALVGI